MRVLSWENFCEDMFSDIDHIKTFLRQKSIQNRKGFYHKHFVSLRYGHFFKLFLEALYKKYAQTYGTWLSLLFDFTKTILSSSFDIASSNIKIKLKQQVSGVGWLIVGGQCGVWSLNQCFTIIYLHIDTETFFYFCIIF